MNIKTLVVALILCLLALSARAISQDNPAKEEYAKVGGLKLPDSGFGVFGVAPHVNQDSDFAKYVPYYARFALWVGAVNAKGQVLVSAGSGNAATARPEWMPDFASLRTDKNPTFPQVERIVSTDYSDAVAFEGHTPLGLNVSQDVYGFNNTNFGLVNFQISLQEGAAALKDVYLGLWVDVDAASEDRQNLTSSDDKLGLAHSGQAPYIFDSAYQGAEIPLLGAMILATDTPIISWWTDKPAPETDAAQYAYLKGEVTKANPDAADDFRFLVSFGPTSLAAGETVTFPVAIVQAPEIADFENNLDDAKEFFTEELGGALLQKQPLAPQTLAASTSQLPQRFHLYQNFPNPFNPETQIQFDLANASHVALRVYNALGQLVRNLVDSGHPAGTFSVTWDGRDDTGQQLPSGIYFYRLKTRDFQAQRKLLLLK